LTRAYARTSVSPSSLTRSSLTRPPRSPQTLAAVSTRYTYTSNLAWTGVEAAADFREVPRSQAAALFQPARDLLDLEGQYSSLTARYRVLIYRLFRSPFGAVGPCLGDDQCLEYPLVPENRARLAPGPRGWPCASLGSRWSSCCHCCCCCSSWMDRGRKLTHARSSQVSAMMMEIWF